MISRIVIFVTVVVIVGLLIWIRRRSARNADYFIGDDYDSDYDSDYSDFDGGDSGSDGS